MLRSPDIEKQIELRHDFGMLRAQKENREAHEQREP